MRRRRTSPYPSLCKVLGVSPSGSFAWKSRPASRRQRQDLVLLAHVRSAFALSNETYGSPRMTRELQDQGLSVGRRRTARLMRENGLRARQPRRFKRTTVTRRMDREPYSADAKGLIRFLEDEVGPWYENRRRDLELRPFIQSQAFGEALKPNRLDQLSRHEVHLDRKLECTLAMLLKLQDLRRPSVPALTDQDATCT